MIIKSFAFVVGKIKPKFHEPHTDAGNAAITSVGFWQDKSGGKAGRKEGKSCNVPFVFLVDATEVPAVHHFPPLTSPWGQLLVSMPSTENTSKLFLVLVSLLLVLPVVEALDAGDTIAFLLGLTVSIVGFCACLGLYARRRNGQQ